MVFNLLTFSSKIPLVQFSFCRSWSTIEVLYFTLALPNLNLFPVKVFNMLDYDDVLDEVGEFGRWQIWLFALLWIPSAVSAMQVRQGY